MFSVKFIELYIYICLLSFRSDIHSHSGKPWKTFLEVVCIIRICTDFVSMYEAKVHIDSREISRHYAHVTFSFMYPFPSIWVGAIDKCYFA